MCFLNKIRKVFYMATGMYLNLEVNYLGMYVCLIKNAIKLTCGQSF